MKKILFILLASLLCIIKIGHSQIYISNEASKKITGAACIAYEKGNDLPAYIKLRQDYEVNFSDWQQWISKVLKLNPEMGFVLSSVQKDQIGDLHYRYIQTYDNVQIQGTTLIVHTKNGKAYSFNGNLFPSVEISGNPGLTESEALASALSYINASKYKWEVPGEEKLLKNITKNNAATYFPKGELFYAIDKSNTIPSYKLSYRFDIYADAPLKRSYVFVDAQNGKILLDLNRIQTTDVPGTAVTKYSGNQTIISDSTGTASYRLRETSRGDGIETYNMQTGTNTGSAVDFTDTDNYWNNVNAEQDEVATDAHWGAEMTYDYFYNIFNRNSIDDNGFKLISYVHYDVDYVNAFWDGQCMTYGDGDATYSPLTTLDICGHEITHGLDEFTANLIYQDESGALNEGYSDIFGTCIEWYARPSNANWTLGEDIGSPFRDLSNPGAYGQPDTYLGDNWDPFQEVHTNSGVLNFWFYLTAQGGSGTNDNGDAYNVTGISMDSAAAVAFRTLTIYLPSGATYADARFYSILSAMDLFGACTPEVETVTNAWYAVGVGDPYNPTVISDFSSNFTSLCSVPSTVLFTNMSTNSNQFLWDFGDGTTSTDMSPSHTYTAFGNYSVSLIAYGGTCGNDTLIQINYITVDTLNPCIIFMPVTGTADIQTACAGQLFDSGGSGNYQDNTNSSITISPFGAMNVTLQFVSFSMEQNYDYLTIYDGPSVASPLIGSYDGTSLPNGGTITSTTGSITLVQTSDEAVNESGFEINWQCAYPTAPPITNFKANDTLSCTGIVDFTDLTTNGPTSWFWDFGDGNLSSQQHPGHTYALNGSYTVKLKTGNSFGLDSLTKNSYITINMPADPIGIPDSRCDSGSVTLTATGGTTLLWYDAATGGNLVYSGGSFSTPVLGATTTYYVQSSEAQPAQYIGPFDNAIGGGGYYTNTTYHYLIFDSYSSSTLKSVKVFANSAGNRTIELTNSSGTVLLDTTVNIPAGESRVTLNFDLPAANGLRLGTDGQNDLWRNNSGAVYPYILAGLISITGNSASSPGYYYYFYDWEIEKTGCLSNRVPVTASILLPNAQVTPNGNIQLCEGDNVVLACQQADSYLWSPGGETTQSITVDAAGSYSVQITDSLCSATSEIITVSVTSNPPTAGFTSSANYLDVTFTNTSANGVTYEWDFGDGNTSQLSDPTHLFSAAGTYTVILVAENVCGTDTFTTTITVEANGITENTDNSVINIYPNPSDGLLYIDVSNLTSGRDVNYSVYDIIGNTVFTGCFNPVNNKAHAVINMEWTSRGVYFVRMYNESINNTFRIIIE
ncbi:MAG: M4 family metallopeptidase [Bacteroidota bacterium]